MGQFTEKKPITEERKKGAPSPGPGRPGLGFWGGRPGPTLGRRRPSPPPWRCPRLAWGGGTGADTSETYL
jgi:hypothetical protein